MEKSTECPICQTAVAVSGEQFPFCSARCRYVDLGLWMNESYRLRAPLTERNIDELEIALAKQGRE